MKSEEIVQKMWEQWLSWGDFHEEASEKEQKLIFLSSEILGLTTYDDALDVHFGRMVLESMKQIQNKTTFEYIKNKNNYAEYILSCNLMKGWLDWGSSIRGAWFSDYDGNITPGFALSNIGYDKGSFPITKGFMEWFIKFLEE